MMVIPIFRPSKRDEVIGILRLVNKKNEKNKNVVDYFNNGDVELIRYACKYLALTFDYFLGEEERNDFVSKLSHEFSLQMINVTGSPEYSTDYFDYRIGKPTQYTGAVMLPNISYKIEF